MQNKVKVIELLCKCKGLTLGAINEENINDIYKELGCSHDEIITSLQDISKFYFSDRSNIQWKFVLIDLYLFKFLSHILNADPNKMLSVQECKHLKSSLQNLTVVGIYTKLEKNLPFYEESTYVSNDIFLNYNILKCTVYGLWNLFKCLDLRSLIIQECLRAILISLYQIVSCPLTNPSANSAMTMEIYDRLVGEKNIFNDIFIDLKKHVHPVMYVRETMLIFQEKSPIWLKKSVSQTLTTIVLSEKGLETIINAMLDSTDDTAKDWKSISIIVKIVLSCRNQPDFKTNILKQVTYLLLTDDIESNLIYERIYVQCVKDLFVENEEICVDSLIVYVFEFLKSFSNTQHKFDECNTIQILKQNIRLLHSLFIEHSSQSPKLPMTLLRKYVNIIFRLYSLIRKSQFKSTIKDMHSIISKYILSYKEDFVELMDLFLFEIPSDTLMSFRSDIKINLLNDGLTVNYPDHIVIYPISDSSESIKELLSDNNDFLVCLFEYLLNCISNSAKYFKKFNEDLLSLEDEYMRVSLERKITVYKWLIDLVENEVVQKKLIKRPEGIILYFKNIFDKALDLKHHKEDCESANFQVIFTSVMILHSLLKNSSDNFIMYNSLHSPLKEIMNEVSSEELKGLINETLTMLSVSRPRTEEALTKVDLSEVDKALEDISDPLLPVRGHGLLALMKLVEAKDKCAMQRKQYIFNIFQQNLKQEDSFLYLSAINGIASMANIFPDSVIQVLCEEYADLNRKEIESGHEVRVKLGEALVKISKDLGEMVVTYKALLLNTFLNSTKDEDYLVRASSLSNLGEICRLLGYKLGSVITEILVCTHSIMATDKSVEVRRAAVLVLRQIFVGCDKDIIAFLKEDILPIYRELKFIYSNDRDDVMRLQAQLALEELNDRMKDYLFPNPTLNMEKKIVMM